MLRLLAVALVVSVAFVASMFVGTVLENRAQALHASQERSNPAIAVSPPSLTPESRD